MRIPSIVAAALAVPYVLSFASSGQTPATPTTLTVTQGTSMAVAVSPDGQRLAVDLQGALWTLPATGGQATRITDLLHDARQPAWSPDGTRIAFQSYRNGTWDIWTVRPDGTEAQSLTPGPFDDREPHWSPDGRRVAFSSDRSGNYDIWVVDVADGKAQPLTRNAGHEYWPAWSPDGREIAFVAAGTDEAGIRAVAMDGTERALVPSRAVLGAPVWTPDGRTVVFSASVPGATRLMAGDREISSNEDVFPLRPQWLASSTLVYTADGVIKTRADLTSASAPRTIPFHADLTVVRPSYAPRPRNFDDTRPRRVHGLVRPGVSPDREQLVFSALGDIWIARRGSAPVRVTDSRSDDTDPAWSPDGKSIAYSSDREGSFDIFVRELSTGTERRLTTSAAADMRPLWSPDGTRIASTTISGLTTAELTVIDVRSGEARRALQGTAGPMSAGWAPDGRTIYVSALRTYSSRFREGANQVLAVPVDAGEKGSARPITLLANASTGKRGEGPAWSPDGRFVATVIDAALHVIPIDATGTPTGPPRQLGQGAADQVSWSFDSTHVVYSENDRVKVVSVSGGAAVEWPLDLTYVRSIPTGTTVVHAGKMIDGVTATAREGVDIVISGTRITRIGAHDPAAHTGRVVDASALTVMPGLIEAHGHHSPEFGQSFGRAHLAYGITSVRSPGAHPYAVVAEREAVDAGRRPGPRLFTTGYCLDGSRIYYPIAAAMITEAGVDRELERARTLEFDFIKTYVRLPDALQQRVIEGAHRIGIPVSSHEIYPAAAFGVDSVEHLSATSRRGYSPKVSLLGRAYEDVIQIVARSGMTITPTLVLGSRAAIQQDAALLSEARWRVLPEWVRTLFVQPTPALPGLSSQRGEAVLAYHKAGARIIAGTDTPILPYGIPLHFEIELYVRAGLTPFEALQTATINVARALHAERDLGTIETGKLADFTFVDGNPLTDIRATRNVRMVMVGGVLHSLEEIATDGQTAPRVR